ncbi:hypothetical protein Ade02nite_92270 [Paractinoplanes deccanensis]|uniref:Flagellar biosynthesis protein FlgA n=1 Tax=Paractinoplanes deccanensis TaxID=113561 RepID=A0ABQ3YKQ1_9ACTN|nr:hypothetical protein Ade02nite_92270 [Actinoplanes deccanensis]
MSRLGRALPQPHGNASRASGEGRLDPVRRRRPARGTLLRLAAVAALLALAALVSWSPPPTCDPPTATASPTPSGGRSPTDAAHPHAATEPARSGGDGSGPVGGASADAAGPLDGTGGVPADAAGPLGGTGGVPAAAGPVGGTGGVPADAAGPLGGSSGNPAVPPGTVGVAIRLADPTALSLVRPGNRVDLLRLDDTKGATTSVAAAALVLTVTGASDPTTGGLLLALPPAEAERAVATPGHGFAVLIRPD